VFKRISLKATQLWWIQEIGVVETMKEGADITLVSWFNIKINWASCSGTSWIGYWLWDYRCTVFASIRYQSWSCKSIAKTSRLLVIDEDVPGGASAYIYTNYWAAKWL
jgi:pyruvate/2-oxoglutarate/acetoin dehydrogenase E1 component